MLDAIIIMLIFLDIIMMLWLGKNVLVLGRWKLKILMVKCHDMRSLLLDGLAKGQYVYKYIQYEVRWVWKKTCQLVNLGEEIYWHLLYYSFNFPVGFKIFRLKKIRNCTSAFHITKDFEFLSVVLKHLQERWQTWTGDGLWS